MLTYTHYSYLICSTSGSDNSLGIPCLCVFVDSLTDVTTISPISMYVDMNSCKCIFTRPQQWRIYHRVGGGGRPPHRYKMPPLLLNCRPPSHYDIYMNTTRVTVFPHRGDVIHSQLSGIVSTTVKIVIAIC